MQDVSERFLQATLSSHRALGFVEILSASDEVIDGVTSCSVTMEADALIQGSMTMSVLDPTGRYLDRGRAEDLLSPYGSEVRPWRGIQYPDGSIDVVPLGTFRITTNDPAETEGGGYQLSITGHDRSSIVSRKSARPISVLKGTPTAEAIMLIILAMYPQATFQLIDVPFTTGTMLIEQGKNPWEVAVNLAAETGLVLHVDRLGVFTTEEALVPGDPPVWAIVDGERSTLTSVPTVGRTSQSLPNGYIVTGSASSVDSATVRGEAWDMDPTSPTFRYGRYGENAEHIQSDRVTSNTQAQAAAELMLHRNIGRANEFNFAMVPNVALDPFDVIYAKRASVGVDGAFYIASITTPIEVTTDQTGILRRMSTETDLALEALTESLQAPATEGVTLNDEESGSPSAPIDSSGSQFIQRPEMDPSEDAVDSGATSRDEIQANLEKAGKTVAQNAQKNANMKNLELAGKTVAQNAANNKAQEQMLEWAEKKKAGQ